MIGFKTKQKLFNECHLNRPINCTKYKILAFSNFFYCIETKAGIFLVLAFFLIFLLSTNKIN